MKLRIHRNSLRFRFDREEVGRLSRGESLEASIQFGPGPEQTFTYRVAPAAIASGDTSARARLERQTLTVQVSSDAVKQWNEGEELALAASESWDGYTLNVLLEKDLQRLNPKPGEGSPNDYPNPNFGKVRCDHP